MKSDAVKKRLVVLVEQTLWRGLWICLSLYTKRVGGGGEGSVFAYHEFIKFLKRLSAHATDCFTVRHSLDYFNINKESCSAILYKTTIK